MGVFIMQILKNSCTYHSGALFPLHVLQRWPSSCCWPGSLAVSCPPKFLTVSCMRCWAA